jgi:glycosyltransferase involved in cell wall biosynthesis
MHIGSTFSLPTVLRLARFARQHQIDIINTQLSKAAVLGSAAGRLAGIPVVSTVRGMHRRVSRYKRADRIIAVSGGVKEYLVRKGVPEQRIDVVYNGVDCSRFTLRVNLAAAKQRVGLAADATVFGIIGRLVPLKGHAWFLDAAVQVCREVPTAYILFVGDGEERHALEAKVIKLDLSSKVRFAGFQQDVVPWMAALDVLVLPSHKEGFARVPMEAGAMEKPVIGTAVGGIPEIIREGETGFVVPLGDVAALTGAMLKLSREADLRRSMGQAARRRVLENFTVEGMVAHTEKVYQELLEKRGRPA